MSKKGGKGVLKRLFSKDDTTEASSSAGGTVTEKKKKKVRLEVIALLFRFVDFFFIIFQKGSVSCTQSPFSAI